MNFDNAFFILLHLAGFSFFVSLAFSGFMISAKILDTANARSAHKNTVPTGGGLGIVAGLGAGFLALSMFYPSLGDRSVLSAIGALAFGVGFLGLMDDILVVNSKLKFLIIIMLASICVYVIGPPNVLPMASFTVSLPVWLGFIGAVLWLFVTMNGVNFMDGSNGLMSGFMSAAFIGMTGISAMVGAPMVALISVIMAGAIIGFIPYNFKNKASIFCGDVGSLLIGFMYGICSLLLAAKHADLLYVGPLLLLPFLVDILLTLLKRARRRENLLKPHSTHLYQRLIKAGHSHIDVASYYTVSAIFMAIITMMGVNFGLIKSVFFLGFWVCIISLIYIFIDGKLRPS